MANETGRQGGMIALRGVVRDTAGRPVAGVSVRLAARSAGREDQGIAIASSGLGGQFAVEVDAARIAGVGPLGALAVEAVDPEGQVLAGFELYSPPPSVEAELVIQPGSGGKPQLDRMREVLAPVLDGRQLTDLGLAARAHIAIGTGEQPESVEAHAAAERLASMASWPLPLAYAAVENGLPSAPDALVGAGDTELRDAWDSAVSSGLVSSEDVQSDALPGMMRAARVRAVLNSSTENEGVATIGDLLTEYLPDDSVRTGLLELYAEHGSDSGFWEAAAQKFPDWSQQLRQTSFALQVASATGGNLLLVRAVVDGAAGDHGLDASRLAALDEQQWQQAIARSGAPLPGWVAGQADQSGQDSGTGTADYASAITQRLEQMFPVQALAARLQASQLGQRDEMVRALTEAGPDVLHGAGEVPDSLKGLVRMHALTDYAGDTVRLMEAKLQSALTVFTESKESFVERFDPALAGSASRVHDRAGAVSAGVLGLLGRILDQERSPVAAVPSVNEDPTVPNWSDLFGAPDLCACEECRSIYGPAAYLVDLLAFVRDMPGGPASTALQELQTRRSDLWDLELSCRNTTTQLPYIDLVCEVLERAVSPVAPALPTPIASITTSAELLATPERVVPAAYDTLKQASYPRPLPFDLPLAEARAYLADMGLDRAELLGRFAPADPASSHGPTSLEIAAEQLGLGSAELPLVSQPASPDAHAAWGMPAATPPTPWFDSFTGDVAKLLDRGGLELDHLRALLRTGWVNASGARLDPPHACALSDLKLVGATDELFDRTHRFERLRWHLAVPIADLDDLLVALGAGSALDEPVLEKLAGAKRLSRALKLDLATLATFWGGLRTNPAPAPDSVWQRTFESAAVRRSASGEPAFALDLAGALTAGGTALTHLPALQAALGLTHEDLDAVLRYLGLADLPWTVETLSTLHRVVKLAHGIGLRVADTLDIASLAGGDPFETPGATERIVTAAKAISQAGTTPAALAVLLGLRAEDDATRSADQTRRLAQLTALRNAAAATVAGAVPVTDPDGTLLAATLGRLLDPTAATAVLALIDDPGPIADDAAHEATLTGAFAHLLAIQPLATNLLGDTRLPDKGQRSAFVLGALAARDRAHDLIITQLAGSLALGTDVTALLAQSGSGGKSLIDDLLEPAFLATTGPISTTTVATLMGKLARVEQIAQVLSPQRLSANAVRAIRDGASRGGWLSFDALPTAPDPVAAPGLFTGWLELRRLFELARAAGMADALFDALGQATSFDPTTPPGPTRDAAHEAVLSRLGQIPGWPTTRVHALAGADALALRFPEDLRTPAGLEKLQQGLATLDLLGVDMSDLVAAGASWLDPDVTTDAAAAIRHAAAGHHEPSDWPQIARPIQDQVRIAERDALVAYLATTEELSEDELFGRYLIDIEMEPCQLTSRVKQAISSVQLYVQRAILGIEPNARPDAGQISRWHEWMHSFRIWQANRKVFLWPENWLDAAPRDDRTPLFRTLEDSLHQSEVTSEAVESAFRSYLDGLHMLGQLELAGSHLQQDGDKQTLHVFARARGKPRKLYYRSLLNGKEWTAWEEVPIEVVAEQVAPVVFNRRLYLFWLLPERKASREPQDKDDNEPHYYWDLTLAWSERRNGNWTGKRLATQRVRTDYDPGPDDEDVARFGLTIGITSDLMVPSVAGPSAVKGLHGLGAFVGVKFPAFTWGDPKLVISAIFQEDPFASWDPKGTYRRLHWVGRWGLGGCEEEPRLTWASTENTVLGGVPFNCDTSLHFGSMCLRPHDERNDGPISIVENATVSGGAAPKREVLLNNAHAGGMLALRADHEYWPFDNTFFYADPTHAFLVRRVSRLGKIVHKPSGEVDLGRTAGELAGWRALQRLGPKFALPPEGHEPVIDPLGPYIASALTEQEATHVNAGARGAPMTLKQTMPSKVALFGAAMPLARTEQLLEAPATMPLAIRAGAPATVRSPWESASTLLPAASAMTAISAAADAADRWHAPDPGIFFMTRVWRYEFQPLHHPWTCKLLATLNQDGVDALLDLSSQYPTPTGTFQQEFSPSEIVATPYPLCDLDFGERGISANNTAFGTYNWELFFHAPVLLAAQLTQSGNYRDAQTWYQHVFDPTRRSSTHPTTGVEVTDWRRVWRFRPFFEATDKPRTIEQLLSLLSQSPVDDATAREKQALLDAIDRWRSDPFKPHLVARFRPGAYQKYVVASYVKNLIAWGDSLFAQDTIESINEATQLFVFAREILGEAVKQPDPAPDAQNLTFATLEAHLDAFSQAVLNIETAVAPVIAGPGSNPDPSDPSLSGIASTATTAYFCIPDNDELQTLRDTVADRLTKIRTCKNIEGVERQLALFEPPIDPGALVRAAAAGISLDTVAGGGGVVLSPYRFAPMLAKALELCADVRALGAGLLAALERRDAEALSQLRASQERTLLAAVRRVRQAQLDDATAAIAALGSAQEVISERLTYYSGRERVSASEQTALQSVAIQSALRAQQGLGRLIASALNSIPTFSVGIAGGFSSPVATVSMGGSNGAAIATGVADAIGTQAELANLVGQQATINAAHERRWDDWQHQVRLATKELVQVANQLLGATARQSAAQAELDAHDVRADQAAAIQDYLSTKFSNQDLFDWMAGQVSVLYFQAYQLALAAARRAERCYQRELAVEDSFIGFDHWDGSRKGLLAGERLLGDLRRMEADYLQRNRREQELTKSISLAIRSPLELESLRARGQCRISLPEWLFDLDHPGHYLRRIRSVSLTVPAVAGPYSNVNASLTLESSTIRMTPELRSGKYLPDPDVASDPRFGRIVAPVQRIATSRGQSDSGLFQLDLRDERYLPFEGCGAVSEWTLRLDPDCNDFDLSSISDVILEFRYTARDGGDSLASRCKEEVVNARPSDPFGPLVRMLSAGTDLSDAWYGFLYPRTADPGQRLVVDVTRDRLPYRARQGPVELTDVRIALRLRLDVAARLPAGGLAVSVTQPDGSSLAPGLRLQPGTDPATAPLPGLHAALSPAQQPGRWTITVDQATIDSLDPQLLADPVAGQPRRLRAEVFEDMLVFVTYVMLPPGP